MAGDWNGDGVDTVGITRGGASGDPTQYWYLKNSNTEGPANLLFGYGLKTDVPVAGAWTGLPGVPQTTHLVGQHYEKNVTTGTITRRYYAAGRLLATRTGSTLTYVQADHLGSATTLTNASGQVVARDRYAAFGERRRSSNVEPTDQLYTSQRFLVQTGLYHYSDGTSAGRFCDPVLARFVQPDPNTPPGSQGLNRYSYVLNGPVKYIDPNGREPCIGADGESKCGNAGGGADSGGAGGGASQPPAQPCPECPSLEGRPPTSQASSRSTMAENEAARLASSVEGEGTARLSETINSKEPIPLRSGNTLEIS